MTNPYQNQDPWANQPPPQGASSGDPWGGQSPGGMPAQPQRQGSGPEPPGLDDLTAGVRMAFNQNTPVGTVVGGEVAEVRVELDRFQPYWDDGNPNWRIMVVIRMQPQDANDDGLWTIALKTYGDNFRAFNDAVKEAGGDGAKTSDVLKPGVTFWAKLTGHRKSSRGGNAELMFAYKIAPTGGQATAPPQQQQAPPPPPPPPPQAPQGQQVPEEPPF